MLNKFTLNTRYSILDIRYSLLCTLYSNNDNKTEVNLQANAFR